jgi:endoglucanase
MTTRFDLVNFLQRLLSQPTAPFHERFVSSFLRAELRNADIDFLLDACGNIIAGSLGQAPVVACVAHMDHPGFEIVEGGTERVIADWYGGVDPKYFIGSRVVIYDQESGGVRARGVVEEIAKNTQGRVERMKLKVMGQVEPGDFGTWDLVPFRRRGEMIFTKGADDLVGCAVILAALRELKARGVEGKLGAFFTRAEEQGFVGTLGMIRRGSVPASTKVISVETSKALPGAVLGGGPVIRLGDRTGMFHHEMILFMDYVAAEVKKKDAQFAFQRRVMDGGTCEAMPYTLAGHIAGGIAVPLHNYHNQGKRRIGPEAVHLRDVEGAARLLVEMITRIDEFTGPAKRVLERFESTWEKYGPRLHMESQGARDQGTKGYKY